MWNFCGLAASWQIVTITCKHVHSTPKRDMKTCTNAVTWQLAIQNATPWNTGKREGHWHASSWTDHCSSCSNKCVPLLQPCSGELRTQKLKSHLVRTQSLNILPLKPGVGHSIAIHATHNARDFFLAYFYPSGPFTCIFSKPLPIFPVLAVTNTCSCVDLQNK